MHPLYPALLDLRRERPHPQDLLRLGTALRRRYPSEQAIWLLQQLELYWDAVRLEAFFDPLPLLFEPQALQMGSRWPLARRRAQAARHRFPEGLWLEIGAGIGGDTLELARHSRLRAVESDPLRLEVLRHNLEVSGLLDRVELILGDGLHHCAGTVALYADPARRNARGREWKHLSPDPQELWKLGLPSCLKLAPGLDEGSLPAGFALDYVSHQGVCKEAVVWSEGEPVVTAWLYRGEGAWEAQSRVDPPALGPLEIGMWLHEPDPAAIRAHCWLPREGWRIDPDLALVATAPGSTSPWFSSFVVEEIHDADLRSLKQIQARRDFSPLEIKKRGFDVEPEELRKKLPKGKSGGPGVIWLTRVQGRHRALVCRRIPRAGP